MLDNKSNQMYNKYEKYNFYNFLYGEIMEVSKGKYMFGICKVGEKGQIVIPKEAREVFNIKAGDSLVLFGDIKKGLAVVKADVIAGVTDNVLGDSND